MNKELAANTTLSHYRIVSKIGEGGMGEVWLAEDTRLGRKVALKLLPAEFTEDSDRVRRFTQEAKAASALNHPNIISVYDIGESETGRFIVMEFVAGRTLRSVIAKDNSLDTFFTLGAQMAKALSAAHAAGITHRDIKPDNIMVRDDGYLKMLDFGLARLLPTTSSDPEAATLAQQTTPGTVMGTLAYMSPEQASGQTVGSASDLFALGIVLYELATGSHPFKSETMIGYLHAITSQTPPSLTSVKSHLPVALDDLILRMLEKNASQRPTASEVAQALQEIEKYGSSNTLPFRVVAEKPNPKRSDEGCWLAVLPFKVRDADPDVAVLADGLFEEVVTGLSRFRYLSVVTSASAVHLTVDTKDQRALSAKLGTRYVLEGSIRKGGSVIRVSVQLLDTETGAQLWSETYNRDLETSTIFDVQDDVAGRIVATAADSYGVLVHSMRAATGKKNDVDLTPVEWQFQYMAYREQISPSAHAALKSRLLRVAEQNVGQSDVWACLAQIHVDEYAFGFQGDASTLDRALAAGRRAVELDRSNQFALVALASVHFFRQDLAAFGPAAERGMALNPLNTDALGILGLQIVHTGQFERGTKIVRRAMELNPNHAGWMHFAPLWNHFHKGEYEQALECANSVDAPGLFWPYLVMASACGHLGRRTEAEAAVKDLLALDPEFATHVRSNVESWHFASGLLEPLLEGLRKAGLEIGADESASTSSDSPVASSETRVDEGFRVAVLPFKATGSAMEITALAEGLSEAIVTGLARFSYLRVIARNSTLDSQGKSSDVRKIGQTLGARYVIEGSLRQSGTKLRLAVQLVDTTTGAHLWAENYERAFSPETIFELQDDLVPRVVSSVADQYGALVHSMSESLRGRGVDQYSAHEAIMRAFGYWERFTPEEHREVREILEAAVARAPDHSDCLAELSLIYWHEYAFGYNVRPDSLDRARATAQRAVTSAPTNHLAHSALATAFFFQKDFAAFRTAAERAIALNRMDASTSAILGLMIAYAGDWEYGVDIVERAMQLNPHHPGWYHYLPLTDAYRRRDYRSALASALKVNMPDYYWPHALLAAVYGQLGEDERAREALRKFLAILPNFAAIAREEFRKWHDPELTEHLLDGLRKAGLEIADEVHPAEVSSALHTSGEKRADEGFWVAVLPFKTTGTDAGLSTFTEGLSDEIVTGLNRFSYLRVIARSSTLRYSSQTSDVRTVGKSLGARYVMEGNVRQAGSVIRVTVQLIDAHTGAHLWAETYDRPFRSEDIFALQDDLVPRIVSTVADQHGVLPHTMSEVLRFRDPDTLRPYEVVLRVFGYYERGIAAEHAELRSALERAVEQAPGSADCWAMLAIMYCDEHKFGFNPLPDSLTRALAAARRAVEASASNPFAYEALAQALFFRREFNAFRNAAERAIALNPLDGATTAFMGMLMACTGDWEHGCAVAERATHLNPHHPGWYWGAAIWNAYRKGDYSEALKIGLKFNMPGFFHHHLNLAAIYGQLGEREAASKELRDLLALKPDFAANARDELGKFFDSELVEHMIDGLRKAGLEIEDRETVGRGDGETGGHGDGATQRTGGGATGQSLSLNSDISSSTVHPVPASPGLPVTPSPRPRIPASPSIAVLPFVNRSPDADNEYFSDGLTEEIISDLSVIKALRVISRNSAMSLKGTAKDTLSIGKELGVSHIVSGSVRKAGDDLRITVELVEVAGDTPLWSDKYSGTIANVFGFQEEISRKIVNALQLRLTDAEAQVIAERPIDNAAAYDCYLRARHEIYLFTAEGLDRAQRHVDSGLSLIGENSLLLATRGMVSWYYLNFSIRPEEKYLDEAAAYATKSLEQDPHNCYGTFLRGLVAAKRGDIESALRDIQTAHEQKPGDSMVLNELIRHLLSAGQELSESRRPAYEESLRLDPLRPLNWAQAAWRGFSAGRVDDCVDAARRVFHLTDPGNPARVYAGYYLAIANKREEAIKVFDAEGAALAGTAYGSLSLFLSRVLQRDAEGAVKHVTPELEQAACWTEYLALFLADGYSLIGHHDAAIRWLRAAVAQGFINYPYLAKRDPLLVSVRSDPRFAELMREVKPRWEALTPSDELSDELQVVDSMSDELQFVADDLSDSVESTSEAGDKLKFIGHSPSIAVLPFVNISNEQDNEYFCDGLAEELLNALSKIDLLRVAARTSAFSFKAKETDIREIGSKLNVSTVLEGSVRKSGNRVRISVQLVNVEDGYHLWSEKYDRELKDIFDIQDEISLAIVDTLKLKLLGAEPKVVKRYTDNTEAYQLYLKGRFFVNQRTSQSLLKAIDYFNQAIAHDANYALGYAGLADAYMVLGVPDAVTEAFSPRDSLIKARDAAEKALKIDTAVGEVYAALAHIKWKERDWTGAEHDYLRSIQLNPHNPIAHFYYAVCLAGLGRCDEAVKEITRAQELDPLSLPVNASVVYVLYLCRRYDEAIEAGKKTLDLDGSFPLTHQRLGLPYTQKGLYREAIAEFEQAVKNSNRAPQPLVSLGHAFAVSGNKVEAENVLAELKEMSESRYVSPYGIAAIYVGLDDKEQAFDWLNRAFGEDNTELTFLKVDPRMDPLREDSRFQELLDRVGFPE